MNQENLQQPPEVATSTDEIVLKAAKKATHPLISIWARPRATMRHIVDTNPRHLVLQLAVLTGVAEVFGTAGPQDFGKKFGVPLTLLLFLVVGSILGVLALYVGGKLLHWSGRWLGGRASLAEVQSAFAWSTVPRISTLPIVLTAILLSDQSWVGSSFYFAPIILLDVWSVVLLVICIGEVQRFSTLKSLASILLVALTIWLCIAVVAGGIGLWRGH